VTGETDNKFNGFAPTATQWRQWINNVLHANGMIHIMEWGETAWL